MHQLLKSEVPPIPVEPEILPNGTEVLIVDSDFSCVQVNSIGIIKSHEPDKGGYAVQVKTHHTHLFGGGTYGSSGVYFFEYREVIECPRVKDSGDTSGAS